MFQPVARCIIVPHHAFMFNNASRRATTSLDRRNALLCLAELRRIDIVNINFNVDESNSVCVLVGCKPINITKITGLKVKT